MARPPSLRPYCFADFRSVQDTVSLGAWIAVSVQNAASCDIRRLSHIHAQTWFAPRSGDGLGGDRP
ncbi:MAG: hypothetical protein WCO60_17090 [Verrucomicrobiota bacterium]